MIGRGESASGAGRSRGEKLEKGQEFRGEEVEGALTQRGRLFSFSMSHEEHGEGEEGEKRGHLLKAYQNWPLWVTRGCVSPFEPNELHPSG